MISSVQFFLNVLQLNNFRIWDFRVTYWCAEEDWISRNEFCNVDGLWLFIPTR